MLLRRFVAATAAVGLALVLGACGTGSKNPYKASTATSASRALAASPTTAAPASSGGVDPNAPEVNPAGDIPDNQVFVPYHPPGGRFTVKVPEGWARVVRGGTVSFTDKLNTIRMESHPAPAAPTVASARRDELPAVRAASRRYEPGTVTQVHRTAGPAVLITYKADAPANPVTGKVVHDAVERYELWHAGTEAVLTLSGPVGADNVDPWRIVTDSFRWR
ncbi:MAG: hypothetical protein ACJ75N_20340 [Actinomycetes bacterium]